MNASMPVWVVATAATTARWCRALGDASLDSHALPWADVSAGADCARTPAALAEMAAGWVVATSEAALRFLPDGAGAGRRIACVGAHTANAATSKDFLVGLVGDGGGAALARALVAGPGPNHALVLQSPQGRPEAAQILRDAGWDVHTLTTYDVQPAPDLAERVAQAPPPRAVVHGSPRAVEALAAACGDVLDLASCAHVALGATTEAALRAQGCTRVAVADHPSALALVATVQRVVRTSSEPE